MPAHRAARPMVAAVSMILTLGLPALVPGCGPAAPEVDKAALYTPESLAGELAFRFRAFSPDEKAASAKAKPKPKTDKNVAERLKRSEQAKNKGQGGAAPKKKRTGPPTIDDLVADIDNKLNQIKGISRPEACRKMVESISGDSSLSENDKKALAELVGQLDGSH